MNIICLKCKERLMVKIVKYCEKVILILDKDDKSIVYSKDVLDRLYKQYWINSVDSIEELTAIYTDLIIADEPFDKVFTGQEHGVLGVGFLNSLLKKNYKYMELAIGTRDKRSMKKHFQAANLNYAKYKSNYSSNDLINNKNHGLTYPIVAKPVCGMGTYNTEIIRNNNELKEYYSALNLNKVIHSEQIIIEEYIKGKEYHADMLWQDGKCIFLSIFQDLVPRIEVINMINRNGSFSLLREMHKELYRQIEEMHLKIIEQLEYFNGIMHTEFFIKDGKIFFSEIAKRYGGGAIIQSIKVAYGVDLIEEWLNIELGIKVNLQIRSPQKIYNRLNFSPLASKGIVKKVPSKEDFLSLPWVKYVEIFLKEGDLYSNSSIYVKSVYLVIEAENEEDLIKKIDKTYKKFPIILNESNFPD